VTVDDIRQTIQTSRNLSRKTARYWQHHFRNLFLNRALTRLLFDGLNRACPLLGHREPLLDDIGWLSNLQTSYCRRTNA